MTILSLKTRILRLERQARLRRRLDAVYQEIVRRQQEGRKRVADWRRSPSEKLNMPPDLYFARSSPAGECLTGALKLLFTALTEDVSSHVTVQDVAGSTQQAVWRPTEYPLGHAHGNALSTEIRLMRRMAEVLESGSLTAPAIFESEQPLIAPLGTSHIEFQKAALLRFLERLPHQ